MAKDIRKITESLIQNPNKVKQIMEREYWDIQPEEVYGAEAAEYEAREELGKEAKADFDAMDFSDENLETLTKDEVKEMDANLEEIYEMLYMSSNELGHSYDKKYQDAKKQLKKYL